MFYDSVTIEDDRLRLREPYVDSRTNSLITRCTEDSDRNSDGLSRIYQEIFDSCATAYQTINKVFPQPPVVVNTLLHRVFEQRVQPTNLSLSLAHISHVIGVVICR